MPEYIKKSGMILPGIDALAAQIEAGVDVTSDQIAALRAMCCRKLRKYRETDFLKRFTSESEKAAALVRWNLVQAFAQGEVSERQSEGIPPLP